MLVDFIIGYHPQKKGCLMYAAYSILCPGQDLNLHTLAGDISSWCVYQFHHLGGLFNFSKNIYLKTFLPAPQHGVSTIRIKRDHHLGGLFNFSKNTHLRTLPAPQAGVSTIHYVTTWAGFVFLLVPGTGLEPAHPYEY